MLWIVLIATVTCVVGLGNDGAPHFGPHSDCFSSPLYEPGQLRVFLTLSPLARTLPDETPEQRRIVLNWFNGPVLPGDWIGLFEHDPTNNPTLPLVRINPEDYPDGSFTTGYQFGWPEVAGSSCLGYWIGYVRNGATIAKNCLKSQLTWMWDNRDKLGNELITKMFLPGTHNSGSYHRFEGGASDTVFTRYLMCQDEDIWNQLAYGIRYLDIRVGYYPDTEEKFWMNHNHARIQPISRLVEDVKKFLQTTREVVVVDFHRFPVGFRQNSHQKHAELVSTLERELGDFMVPAQLVYNATLNAIWRLNKTLIVAYADDHTKAFHPLLWPRIPQEWGDKRNVDDLFTYLSEVSSKRLNYNYFWTAMAELTPSTFDVVFRPNDGLRKLANQSNGNVTTWYRDLWWSRSNSVAVDFFHSTDIVDIAIAANLKKVQCNEIVRRVMDWSGSAQQTEVYPRFTTVPPLYQGPRSLDLRKKRRRLNRRRGNITQSP